MTLPPRSGLYDPKFEHDACGVGFVANIKGEASHDIVKKGIDILLNLDVGHETNAAGVVFEFRVVKS